MSKNTNLSFLTDYITADITNGRIGINNTSPTVAFDVTGIARTTGATYLATASGNVGIGTIIPANALSIDEGTATASYLQFTAGTTTGQLATDGFEVGIDASANAIINQQENLPLMIYTNNTERMRITSGGNVGIGTSSPNELLVAYGLSTSRPRLVVGQLTTSTPLYSTYNTQDNPAIEVNTSTTNGFAGFTMSNSNNTSGNTLGTVTFAAAGTSNGEKRGAIIGSSLESTATSSVTANLVFYTTSASSVTERMRITSGGFLKASNTGTYHNSSASYHELRSNITDEWTVFSSNSSASPYGFRMLYANTTPNNTINEFFTCIDSSANRLQIRSNGGIANFQANNVNLSDKRTKKDIAPLESYWNKFKDIEIVKFKYKDQSHDDFNIGVIAQQVESIAPEFVDADGWGDTPEDGIPLKSIYTADLYHATIKVLQEAMIKIEELSAKVTLLENK